MVITPRYEVRRFEIEHLKRSRPAANILDYAPGIIRIQSVIGKQRHDLKEWWKIYPGASERVVTNMYSAVGADQRQCPLQLPCNLIRKYTSGFCHIRSLNDWLNSMVKPIINQ
jgi:hypothetical protein